MFIIYVYPSPPHTRLLFYYDGNMQANFGLVGRKMNTPDAGDGVSHFILGSGRAMSFLHFAKGGNALNNFCATFR